MSLGCRKEEDKADLFLLSPGPRQPNAKGKGERGKGKGKLRLEDPRIGSGDSTDRDSGGGRTDISVDQGR
jgi:hypothetical protein